MLCSEYLQHSSAVQDIPHLVQDRLGDDGTGEVEQNNPDFIINFILIRPLGENRLHRGKSAYAKIRTLGSKPKPKMQVKTYSFVFCYLVHH